MFLLLSIVLSFSWAAPPKAIVGYFSKEPITTFESKVRPLFEKFTDRCSGCEIRNLTPYSEKGDFDESKLSATISSLPEDVSFIFFDFNERSSDKNQGLIEALSKKAIAGKLVIASAGVPPNKDGVCPLNKTMMGQVTDSLIIGELTERDRLLPQCFYGPEMLSAIRPPREIMGQGFAPLLFASRLASQWSRRSSQDWKSYLKARKSKTKKLWVDLEDFFPR